jgi:hypothetical protein
MKSFDLYKALDNAGLQYEIVEMLEGVRIISFQVTEHAKYTIKECSGYWVDEPLRIITGVRVALEAWDCEEDHEDESVFFYMDNEPLRVGSFIAEGFVVTEIEGGSDE